MSARLQELARHAMTLKIANYARDGWVWFGEQMRTHDEHDKIHPVKRFPVEKEYLWTSYSLWLDEDWTIWEKTRQLMYSWLFSGAHLHLAMFTPYRRVLLASKTETDSIALLDRHEFIYDNQGDLEEFGGELPKPEDRKPGDCAIKRAYPAERIGNELRFANGSVIVALPRGKDKARSYVCSALFADEFGFMEDGEELFGAAIPALTGGGKFTGVSSANPGHMESIVGEAKRHASRHIVLMPGLEVWTSKGEKSSHKDEMAAGFTVVRAHYSADPDPYLQDKVRQARAMYKSTGRLAFFNKEYEIIYDALSGEKIYPHFDESVHVIPPIDPALIADWTKIRVIDPGWRNACAVVWIAVSPPGWRGCVYTDPVTGAKIDIPVMVVYREFHEAKVEVADIITVVKFMSVGESYSADLIDPSSKITKGNEAAGLNTFNQFIQGGIPVIEANNTVAPGLDEVRRRFAVYGGSPALLICSNCTVTIEQHKKYRYKDVSPAVLKNADAPETPVKKNDHTCDCVRYGCQWDPLPEKEGAKPVPKGSFAEAAQSVTKQERRGTWASMKW